MNELAFTESPSLRAEHAGRVEALDKVKALSLLPDGIHATTDLVASYYGVTPDTIEQIVRRNRPELESNGYTVLSRPEFEKVNALKLSPKARQISGFTRRTILCMAPKLANSEVAHESRTCLLDAEQIARALHGRDGGAL